MNSLGQLQYNGLMIMKSALYLTSINKKSRESQRNLLNKWFQDSIKNYILEQVASTLISKQLSLKSSADVKNFIHKSIDVTKPKYMGIIDQYFMYIRKFNQEQLFIERLVRIVMDPINSEGLKEKNDYNTEKIVRKQFVCYLLLRFFEIYGQEDIPSFYELWNYCFPSEIQIKKKLSRFDKKQSKTEFSKKIDAKPVKNEGNDSSRQSDTQSTNCSSSTSFSLTNFLEQKTEQKQEFNNNLSSQQISTPFDINSSQTSLENEVKKPAEEQEEIAQGIVPQKTYPSQKTSQINNRIFEEDDDEEYEYVGMPQQQLLQYEQSIQQEQPIFNSNQLECQHFLNGYYEDLFVQPQEQEQEEENSYEYDYCQCYQQVPSQYYPSQYYQNNQGITYYNQYQCFEANNQYKPTPDQNHQQYIPYEQPSQQHYQFC